MRNSIVDVVGAKEASEILGVELQRISRWRRLGRLPPPYADLALSPVWIRVELQILANVTKVGSDTHPRFTPPPDPPPLLGTAEVAAFLAIDKSQIARWRNGKTARVEFPRPDTLIAAGPLWARSTIEKFAEGRGKKLLLTEKQAEKILASGATLGDMPTAGHVKTGYLYQPDAIAVAR